MCDGISCFSVYSLTWENGSFGILQLLDRLNKRMLFMSVLMTLYEHLRCLISRPWTVICCNGQWGELQRLTNIFPYQIEVYHWQRFTVSVLLCSYTEVVTT